MFEKFTKKKKTPSTFFSEFLRVEVEIKCKINQFKPVLIFDQQNQSCPMESIEIGVLRAFKVFL